MITEDKILKNTTKYFETGEKYGFMTDDLLDFLGQDFIKAPASTTTSLHNCFQGGLVAHLLLTAKYAMSINGILPESMRVETSSLLRVCLLHQIGKAKLYKPLMSDWHNKKGIMFDFNEEVTSMRVGERSAIYALSNGVTLSEEEFQAIINHDKDDSDKQAKWYSSTLATILKQANELAIMEEKSFV